MSFPSSHYKNIYRLMCVEANISSDNFYGEMCIQYLSLSVLISTSAAFAGVVFSSRRFLTDELTCYWSQCCSYAVISCNFHCLHVFTAFSTLPANFNMVELVKCAMNEPNNKYCLFSASLQSLPLD